MLANLNAHRLQWFAYDLVSITNKFETALAANYSKQRRNMRAGSCRMSGLPKIAFYSRNLTNITFMKHIYAYLSEGWAGFEGGERHSQSYSKGNRGRVEVGSSANHARRRGMVDSAMHFCFFFLLTLDRGLGGGLRRI
jgi:hypothetical protein